MRTYLSISVLFVFALVLAGCGGSKSLQKVSVGEVPDWFTSPPQDPNFLYAAVTSTSRDLGIAIDKATINGRAEIARQYEVKVQGLTKSFQEEIGSSENTELNQTFSKTIKTVVSTQLMGSRASKRIHVRDGSYYRAYVLVEYPIGAAHKAFMNALKANQNMYTRFRASQAFKEMDDEVKKYEEWKKEQQTVTMH